MARPVFMVCVHATSQDEKSKFLSLFEVIDQIQLTRLPEIKPGERVVILWRPMRVMITWMQEEGDAGQEYETEFLIFRPQEEAPIVANTGPLLFIGDESKPFHRQQVNIDEPIPLEKTGLMWFESRIRKVGSEQWNSQKYPVTVVRLPEPPPA